MYAKQNLTLDQKLTTRLSLQQLRFVKLLELTAPELEDAVEKELEANPALEAIEPVESSEDIPHYRLNQRNSVPSDFADFEFSPPDHSESLYDSLLSQLDEKNLSHEVEQAARYIVGSLDSNGYLRRPLPSLVNDMAFGPGIEVTPAQAEEALETVRNLEPYGVGASNLKECLLLQARRLPASQAKRDAMEILENQFEAFSMKHTHRIISGLKISKERVRDAIDLILALNPKPGASVGGSDIPESIVPDLVVTNDEGILSVGMNNRIPELAIEHSFSEAVREMEASARSKRDRKGMEFITTSYNDARDFIKILRQRQDTLLKVMTAIMKIQEEYFATEDVYKLKPMMLKDISALTGLDFSVISRATANKHVATPWGVFPLRFFFSDSIGDENPDSDALTNRKIEAEIESIVDNEDKRHPLSDENIRMLMLEKGYDVSRRTVAKYRDRKGIPVARLRKEL